MTKEFVAILTSIVLLLGLLSSTTAGVWWVSKLESRISSLEDINEWQMKIETQQKINTQRWQRHFQLWGDAIERKSREIGNINEIE